MESQSRRVVDRKLIVSQGFPARGELNKGAVYKKAAVGDVIRQYNKVLSLLASTAGS